MNLAIDIGNTLAKLAIIDGGQVVDFLKTEQIDTAYIEKLLKANPGIDAAVIVSSRDTDEELERFLEQRMKRFLRFDQNVPVPIVNRYATPGTLGADRLAAAVGANTIYPNSDILIVDFGTAITVDYVSGDGTYRGGAISPGMGMRFQALHRYTARLPLCRETAEERLYGTTTTSCIEQGVMNGIAFEIEGYIARFRRENADICIIFTGGAAKNFAKRIKNAIFADCELVFLGLNRILEFNAEC